MVYLIHFDRPYKHARHYIGFTDNIERRLHEHELTNKGAKLLQAASKAGIKFIVARVWKDGDRTFERKLKKRKKSSCLCPLCLNERKGEVNDNKGPSD